MWLKIQAINWRKCIFHRRVSLTINSINNLSPCIFYRVSTIFWSFKIIYLFVIVHPWLGSHILSFVIRQFLKFGPKVITLYKNTSKVIIYLYNILGFVRLRWSSFPSIRLIIRRHPSHHPFKAKRGRARALLKLQNSTVSGNCPFCPIYSTIGIHPVMKGFGP